MGEQEQIERLYRIMEEGEEKDVDFAIDVLYSGESRALRELAIDALVELGKKYNISEKIAELLRSDDAFTRNAAIEILARIKAIDVLEKLLKDEDKEVRKYALDALSRIEGDEASRAIALALDDKDPNVRFAACEYIGQRGYKEVEDKLISMLEKEESEYGISVLLDTLTALKSKKALSLMKRKYEKFKESPVAISFFRAISSIEGKLYCDELERFQDYFFEIIEILNEVEKIECPELVEKYILSLPDEKLYSFPEEILKIAIKVGSRKIVEKLALILPDDETIYSLFELFEEACEKVGIGEDVVLKMLEGDVPKRKLGAICSKYCKTQAVAFKLLETLAKGDFEDIMEECAKSLASFPPEKIPPEVKDVFLKLSDNFKVLLLSPSTAKVIGKDELERIFETSQNIKLKYKILKVAPPSREKLIQIAKEGKEPLRTLAQKLISEGRV